jgi:hypothetical protein
VLDLVALREPHRASRLAGAGLIVAGVLLLTLVAPWVAGLDATAPATIMALRS